MIERALISVSDKSGIVDLATVLAQKGVEILSTGGTAIALREAGLDVVEVSETTGFPEILGGRVKTLHPTIHAGILARRDCRDDHEALKQHSINPIDLVVVNLYPFRETLAGLRSGNRIMTDCIEMIDIGGPTLLRAAAKNYQHVTVLVEPGDYSTVIKNLNTNQEVPLAERCRLAAVAFAHVAAYDAAISSWLTRENGDTKPPRLSLSGRRVKALRYGENPHQQAALYAWDTGSPGPGIATSRCLQGRELSYNNIHDAHACLTLAAEFSEPACVIVKHANPCGVACRESLAEAFQQARSCDPVSAFGGVIAFNRCLDSAAAEAVSSMFAEVVIAPEITSQAQEILAKKPDIRLLETDGLPDASANDFMIKMVSGGFLLQDTDDGAIGPDDLSVVTQRAPNAAEQVDLLVAWKVCKHVSSNAIVYVKNQTTVGIGAGQMSRVDSARIAADKAQRAGQEAGETTARTQGSVLASDAFFPFADGLEVAIEAGATAVIQPGGSKRDSEVIALANEAGLAMVFTGMRHFRH